MTLSLTGSDPNKLKVSTNKFLFYFQAWANQNCLEINANKAKAVFFRSRNKIVRLFINLYLGSNNIEFVQEIKP